MTEDNKTEEKNNRKDRGKLGVATPSCLIKQLWAKDSTKLSLKQFARKLKLEGNEIAKDWSANKSGQLNKSRSDANIKAAIECASASKAARKK